MGKGREDVAVWETWGPRGPTPVTGEGRQDGERQRPRVPRTARPLPRAPLHRPADTPRRFCSRTGLLWSTSSLPEDCRVPTALRTEPAQSGLQRTARSGADHTGATERPRVQERPRDPRGWAAVPRAWPHTGTGDRPLERDGAQGEPPSCLSHNGRAAATVHESHTRYTR